MAVKIVTLNGDEILFNPSFRVQGLSVNRRVPSLPITGRDGEIPFSGMISFDTRPLVITGSLYGSTPGDTQTSLDYIMQILRSHEDVRLYLDETEGAFYYVKLLNTQYDFQAGTGRKVANLTLSLNAYDPSRYSDDVHVSEQTGTAFTFTNAGNKEVMPEIWITSGSNPEIITNETTHDLLQYAGTINAGEILMVKPQKRIAKKLTQVVYSGSMAAVGTWTVQLDSGASATDEEYTGKTLRVTSGNGKHQFVTIIAYNGTNKLATIAEPWDVIPVPTDTFSIWDSVGVVNDMGQDFRIYGFSLAPGDNDLTISPSLTFGIRYRDKWI